jgi:hypothetical protein
MLETLPGREVLISCLALFYQKFYKSFYELYNNLMAKKGQLAAIQDFDLIIH